MKVRVQFFSRLRDLAGTPALDVDVPDQTTVADLLNILYRTTPGLREWDKSILIAAGVEFVQRSYSIKPGDEIAVMPPVQGG